MQGYDPRRHHRRSVRLRGYDYRQPGAYFVTICVRDGACVLGQVVDGRVEQTEFGQVAHEFWAETTDHFPDVCVDTFVVMPNHVHAIVVIGEPCCGRGEVTSPLRDAIGMGGEEGGVTPPLQDVVAADGKVGETQPPRPTLGQIVAYYKYQTTVQINAMRGMPGTPFWQRSFYDHVIRNERDRDAIREYIASNPRQWELDRDNPANIKFSRG